MKLLILFTLIFTSCSTTVYRDGRPILKTYANATGFHFQDGSTSLSADKLDHSSPTRAAGSIVGTGLSGVAGVIAAKAATGGIMP